ncbi:MAG: response regulator transcription factor [Sphaerochaeta sp.]
MSKFTLIISDDDEILLAGLLSLVKWNDMDIEVVASATNGIEALEAVKKFRPTILLTDIKMPLMNGVELMKHVKKVSPQTIIVVISAYDDFSYAKSAIQNGASDYILKPIDVEKLSQAIKSLLEDAQEHSQLVEKLDKIKSIENELEQSGIKEMFDAAMFRKYSEEQFKKTFKRQLDRYRYKNYQVLLLRNHLSYEEYASITKIIEDHFSLKCVCIAEFMRLYIAVGSDEDDFDEIRAHIKELSKKQCGLNISFSCGLVVQDIYNLYESNHESKILDELGYDEYENQDLVSNSMFKENFQVSRRIAYSLSDKLYESLMKGDMPLLNDYFDRYEEALKSCGENASNILIYNVNAVFFKLTKQFESIDIDLKTLCNTQAEVSFNILERPTFKERLEAFRTYIQKIADYYQGSLLGSHEESIRKSCDYIDENYSNSNLSLSDVADYVGMSKNYFSTLFGEIMKKTYSEYLTECRIREAQRLLMNTKLKNYEIANRVGFENPTYFSFAFKKVLGVTPSSYVKMIKE